MSTNENLNHRDKSMPVSPNFEKASVLKDQVISVLTKLGQGTAEEVVKKMESLLSPAPDQEVIAATHQILTELHKEGVLAGLNREGSIIYSLPNINHSNK